MLILSEAARKLGTEADGLVPGQPWADIRAMGNVLRHEYDGVDPRIIWRILEAGDLRSPRQAVEVAVARIEGGG